MASLFVKGWLPDLPDQRDYAFTGKCALTALPPSVDLRASDSPIYNQGNLGSCTGNSIGAMFQFVNRKDAGKDFIPSRLFIYYGERAIEGHVSIDSGAYIRDGMKVLAKRGVCAETTWPYNIGKFKNRPIVNAFKEASLHQAIVYQRLDGTLTSMKQCLADGYPFVFGFSVYESFESDAVAKTGIVPMPSKTERQLGGHAVMAIGYDDTKKAIIVRNSWGADWGDKGYFYLPYDYISNTNLADDFWTLRKVELAQ